MNRTARPAAGKEAAPNAQHDPNKTTENGSPQERPPTTPVRPPASGHVVQHQAPSDLLQNATLSFFPTPRATDTNDPIPHRGDSPSCRAAKWALQARHHRKPRGVGREKKTDTGSRHARATTPPTARLRRGRPNQAGPSPHRQCRPRIRALYGLCGRPHKQPANTAEIPPEATPCVSSVPTVPTVTTNHLGLLLLTPPPHSP